MVYCFIYFCMCVLFRYM
uniref:Uncharacterized protein n=1 Tax=Arundo donax TaxID=35708 RepID=A0A0A9ABW4_ARUDO